MEIDFFPRWIAEAHTSCTKQGVAVGKAGKFILFQLKVVLKAVIHPSSSLFFLPDSLLLPENLLLKLFHVAAASL